MRLHTVLMHRSVDDVQYTAHGITSIEYGGRTTKHLYALCHQRLIAVGDGMTIDTVILRMSVDKYEQLSCTTRDTTQADSASSTSRYAVAHH